MDWNGFRKARSFYNINRAKNFREISDRGLCSQGLCALCQTITFDALGSRIGFRHFSIVNLYTNVMQTSCPLCIMIWESVCSMQDMEELGPVKPILEDRRVYLVSRYCSRMCWGPNYSLQTMERISCIDVVWEWVDTSENDENDEMLDSVPNPVGNDFVGDNELPDETESAKDGVDGMETIKVMADMDDMDDMEDAEDEDNSSDAQNSDKAEDCLVPLDGAGFQSAVGFAEDLERSCTGRDINHTPEDSREITDGRSHLTSLGISVEHNSQISDLFIETQANPLETSFHMIRSWINHCTTNHETCNVRSHHSLDDRSSDLLKFPSRVVDVGLADGSTEPCLVLKEDLRILEPDENFDAWRYVALSYCWGSTGSAMVTTSLNLDERRKRIPEADMPQTIKDAVTFARQLGIRYLWVDAICIIQGQDDLAVADWEWESARMSEIYGCAFLTIIAARASDVHEGFLGPRQPKAQLGVCCKLPYASTTTPGRVGSVWVTQFWQSESIYDEPLFGRAWALQERLLSPRMVIFGSTEMRWECKSLKMTESGITPIGLGTERLDSKLTSKHWDMVVQEYTCRALSQEKDKLPALSGLAREFFNQYGDEYLAGLWQNTLVHGLLWGTGRLSGQGRQIDCNRPSTYRAPSWSWASVEGNVHISSGPGNAVSTQPFDDQYTELLDHSVRVVGFDAFGQVGWGMIVLRGPLNRIEHGMIVASDGHWKLFGDVGGVVKRVSIVLDLPLYGPLTHTSNSTESTPLDEKDIWCLRILSSSALILRKLKDHKSMYERIGKMEVEDRNLLYFDSWEKQIISII